MQAAQKTTKPDTPTAPIAKASGGAGRTILRAVSFLILLATAGMNPAWAGATTTALTSSANPSKAGQTVTLTATVTGTSPTGTVTFMNYSTTLGTATLDATGVATLNYTFTAPGGYGLTASYAGDANNSASTSSAIGQTVSKATTSTALAISPNPATAGQMATFTATVTGGVSPTGTVTFVSQSTWASLGTAPLANGTATLNLPSIYAGSTSIVANYSGDANNAWSGSPAVVQVINKATTTTTLTSNHNPAAPNQQPVTLTATVSGYNASGYVYFYDGTTYIGLAYASGGVATFNYTFSLGTHNIAVGYGGDSNNLSSTSNTLVQTVAKATTTTTLASSPNPSLIGQAVTLTATVTGSSPGGAITFYDGATALGTATLANGSASLNYTFATGGAHSLTASYAGDANNAVSTSTAVSQTVNTPSSSTTLTSSLNPSAVGQAVTLTATVTGSTPTGTVTFKEGTATIGTGTLAAGTATLSYTFATAGAHSLTAAYGGDANNTASTSTAVAQTVNTATSTTTLTSGLNPSAAGQAVTLTATVTGVSPTGTVIFKDSGTWVGQVALTGGVATINYTFGTAGARNVTADYSGDASNAPSTTALAQTVNQANATLALTSSLNPSTAGQQTTLTATVTGAMPTGVVTFMDGTTTLGTGTIYTVTGTATLGYTFNTGGAHNLTAAFAGDANNTAATSPAVAQTVNPAASATTLTSGLNPSATGVPVTLTATVTGAVPTGAVTFMDGTTTLGTGTITGGIATLSYTFTTAGTHSLTAVYPGDSGNLASTSAAVSQNVLTTTTTTLASSLNPSAAGQTVTLTATVNGNAPTGTVTFTDGATTLGTATVTAGTASINYTFQTLEAHSLKASYAGDASNTASTSAVFAQNVFMTSATTLTANPNPSGVNQAITLTATVTGATPTGTVTFMDGAATLGTGTITSGIATLGTSFTTAGTHSLTAVYGGNINNTASTSAAVSQSVLAVSTTTLTANPSPSGLNQPVTLTAAVSGVSPTGTVNFMDGTTTLGTGTITGGTATLSATFTTVGVHSLTASYAGDAGNPGSNSAVVSQVVVATAVVYYIRDDHLDTPRAITDTAGNVVWQWDNTDPFANNAPNENPSAQGTFHFNVRFPGQYYDTETGLNYNRFRDYDPSIGRYVESDPIGLYAGVNTYAYVLGNPLSLVDPDGLDPSLLCALDLAPFTLTQIPNPDKKPTIQCNGKGGYETVYTNTGCDAKCTEEHEQSHIWDHIKRFGANSCASSPQGFLPVSNEGQAEFMRQSECKAYQAGLACRRKLQQSGKCDVSKQIQNDLDQIKIYCGK